VYTCAAGAAVGLGEAVMDGAGEGLGVAGAGEELGVRLGETAGPPEQPTIIAAVMTAPRAR
jgi:hypothetical protein